MGCQATLNRASHIAIASSKFTYRQSFTEYRRFNHRRWALAKAMVHLNQAGWVDLELLDPAEMTLEVDGAWRDSR